MCINPGEAVVFKPTGRIVAMRRTDGKGPALFIPGPQWEKVPVPCRECWQCLAARVNDYVGRSLCEVSISDWVCCVTLTYAPRDDLADQVLTPRHFQNFVRALRKRGHSVRYLVAGEYGALKGRAHFHALLFGRGSRPNDRPNWQAGKNAATDEWPHGHIFVDWTGEERAVRYVCKYLLKSVAQGEGWFSCSKKPSLGLEWFIQKAHRDAALAVLPSTFAYTPPGAKPGRRYPMTGATRREYLRALCGALNIDRSKANEWVQRSLQKLDKWQRLREWQEYVASPEGRLDLAETVDLLAADGEEPAPALVWGLDRRFPPPLVWSDKAEAPP